jgi:hypothetical protein
VVNLRERGDLQLVFAALDARDLENNVQTHEQEYTLNSYACQHFYVRESYIL